MEITEMSQEELMLTLRNLEVEERLYGLSKEQAQILTILRAKLVERGPKKGYDIGVSSLKDFRTKYGVQFPWLLVRQFIISSPDFTKKNELAHNIAILMADLESVHE